MGKDENKINKIKNYDRKRYKKYNKKVIQLQKKVIDNSITSALANLSGTWTKVLLNGVVRGTDETQIIAREGLMHSVFIRGSILPGSSQTGVGLIRLAIIYDRQPNGSTFATTDCFKEDSFRSPTNLDNRKRFQIIHDEVLKFSNYAQGDEYYAQSVYIFHKLQHMMELNTTNGGTVADFTRGALYLCGVSNGSYAVGAPSFNLISRVRFTDNNDYVKSVSNLVKRVAYTSGTSQSDRNVRNLYNRNRDIMYAKDL